MNGRRSTPACGARVSAALLSAIGLLSIPAAFAQPQDEPDVTVAATPGSVPVGGAVRLTGTCYPQPGVPVILVVTPPGDAKDPAVAAASTTLNATPAAGGDYSVSFAKTQKAGLYAVSARMGTQGASATTQFAVRPLGQVLDDVPKQERKLTTDTVVLIDTAVGAITNLPDSPARTQLLANLSKLGAQTKQLPDQSAKLATALQPFKQLASDHPETGPTLQPLFDKLDGWNGQAQKADDQLQAQIAQTRQKLASCDRLDQTIEALKAVSAALNFAGEPFKILFNFENDFVASRAPAALPGSLANDSNAKFAVSEAAKFAPTVLGAVSGPVGMFGIAAGLITDAITQAEQNAFDKYCQKFEGPFTARMEARFYAAGHVNDPWWTYSIDIAGKLVLRYPKDAAGKAVALTGQFEGGATRFTYDEEVWKNSDLFKLVKGGIVAKRDQAPIATPHLDYEGSLFGAYSSPTSFYIPVSGQFANGRITFKLENARTDFNAAYTQAHTFYVVVSLYALVPVPGHFSLPYKDAHWVLDHYTFDYPVTQTANSMFIQKHDEQSRPTNGTKAYYTLDLKACNPGCG